MSLYDVADDRIPLEDRRDLPGEFLTVDTGANSFENGLVIDDLVRAVIEADAAGQGPDEHPPAVHLPPCTRGAPWAFYSRRRSVRGTRAGLP